MKRKCAASLCLVALACLTGCSAKNDDPRQGGLLGGLHGVYGGGYDKRVQERSDQLASQHSLHQKLELESHALANEYRLVDAQLIIEQQALLNLEKELQALAAQIAGNQTGSARRQRVSAVLTSRIGQLQQKIREQHAAIDDLDQSGGDAAAPDQYQTLQDQRNRLGAEYQALRADCQAVGGAAD